MSAVRTRARAQLEAMLKAPLSAEADAEIRAAMLDGNQREISPEQLAGYADALRAASVPIAWDEPPREIGASRAAIELPREIGASRAAIEPPRETEGICAAIELPRETEGIRAALTDTCGTGGDQRHTFNISTAAALLAAAAGVPVAKHGNRSATSKCGSADVLEALGIPMQGPENAAAALRDLHFAFLFAPAFHPAMARVAPLRRTIGVRTFFNLLGPLANPAGATRQLIGTWSAEAAALMARTLALLGAEHAMVVHASDGMDEITLTGPTFVAEVRNGTVREFELSPRDFGFDAHTAANPYAGADTAAANADIILRLFAEPHAAPLHREIVLANTAAVLYVAGRAATWQDGVALAAHTLDSGNAARHLQRLQENVHA